MLKKLLLCSAASILSIQGLAGTDSCEDLNLRQYRADLEATKIKVENVESDEFGDHQLVELTLRNSGTVRLGPAAPASPGDFHVADINVQIKNVVSSGYFSLPIQAGGARKAYFRVPAGTIKNCSSVFVDIDLDHTAYQNGCDCYDNDAKTFIKVHVTGESSCRQQAADGF